MRKNVERCRRAKHYTYSGRHVLQLKTVPLWQRRHLSIIQCITPFSYLQNRYKSNKKTRTISSATMTAANRAQFISSAVEIRQACKMRLNCSKTLPPFDRPKVFIQIQKASRISWRICVNPTCRREFGEKGDCGEKKSTANDQIFLLIPRTSPLSPVP